MITDSIERKKVYVRNSFKGTFFHVQLLSAFLILKRHFQYEKKKTTIKEFVHSRLAFKYSSEITLSQLNTKKSHVELSH